MRSVVEMVEFLKKCDEAYYNSSNPIVSNDTYDSMVESLKRMDPTNEYLNKVGAQPNGSNKVGRLNPMGTLDKFHTDEEVREWVDSERCFIMVSPKYDGFGVELTYVEGKLVLASTRGDGNVGEDVTDSVLKLDTVPKTLPDKFKGLTCVRGECIIPRKNHEEIKALGYTAMRNAVPGIVRSCREDALKYVDFVAYEFFDGDDDRVAQRLRYKDLFIVEDYTVSITKDFDSILSTRNHWGDIKESYDYEIDGTVLKTVEIKFDDYRHPKHQIAWKFKSNRRETILRSVEFSMGVTGRFSVVGTFDEVEFQGAKLTRASLGSIARFRELNPKIGCVVEVSRRGDIIPYIEEIVEYPEGCIDVEEPKVCPHCGFDMSNLSEPRCMNLSCQEKLKQQISYYVGTIGVKGIGPALVRGLVESGKITRLYDVYNVKDEDILSLPRQGQSAVDKWNAFKTKEIQLEKFLSAMPFDDIGPAVWKSLLKVWDFEDIMNLTEGDIYEAKIPGLGASKINSLISQINVYKEDMYKMYETAIIK